MGVGGYQALGEASRSKAGKRLNRWGRLGTQGGGRPSGTRPGAQAGGQLRAAGDSYSGSGCGVAPGGRGVGGSVLWCPRPQQSRAARRASYTTLLFSWPCGWRMAGGQEQDLREQRTFAQGTRDERGWGQTM